jgi:hypothetical protein
MEVGLVPASRSGRLRSLESWRPGMLKVTVVAQKSTRHRGKLYRKGQTFNVPPRVARVFGALGKARLAAEAELGDPLPARPPRDLPPVPAPSVPRLVGPDPLAGLRTEYEALIGEVPDRRWGEARLRSAIRDHKDALVAAAAKEPLSPDEPGELL